MASTVITKPIISADSHIMEPPNTYLAHIDKKYKDTAPKVVWDDNRGDTYVIDGMKETIPMGLVAAAGKKAEELAGLSARASRISTAGAGTRTRASRIRSATAWPPRSCTPRWA